MASMLIRDMPAELKKRLQERAAENRRSMVQELLHILERDLRALPAMYFDPVRPSKPLTEKSFWKAVRSGRK